MALESAIFCQMECGTIVESWALADNLGRLREVSALTDDEIRTIDAVVTPAP